MLINAIELATVLAAGIGILIVLGSISSKKNNKNRAKISSTHKDKKTDKSDRADNPYSDDDDFGFREPKWHQPPHRHREEDADYLR